MHIRHSQYKDLPRIMDIYREARQFMKDSGNPRQWGMLNWPPEDMVRRDIDTGKGYVCVDGDDILAVFFFEHGYRIDPTYGKIDDGSWIGDDNYGVVHRIASCARRKGVGAFCIQWAYEQCGHLRIDTHGDNIPMQNLLKKLGFSYCGVIYVGVDSDPRLAYEKV